jgi:hypothetical protein
MDQRTQNVITRRLFFLGKIEKKKAMKKEFINEMNEI